MNVEWTESALADLRVIRAQIARHSAHYADGMIARVFGRTGDLAYLPRLGPMVPEYADDDLRELFEDPYRIAYRIIEGGRVDIVVVVHAGRRFPRGS